MMKNPRVGLFLLLVAVSIAILIPCQAMAQDTNPPPCCDKEPPPGDSAVGAETQGQVTMPDSVLLAMGLTRSQFLDRLAAALFPDKPISLIFSVTTTITVSTDASATDTSPVMVTVSYQYRISRSQMKAEEIDVLNQFVVTDGVTSIQIKFTPDQSSVPLQ
jgi:hypothetical protein